LFLGVFRDLHDEFLRRGCRDAAGKGFNSEAKTEPAPILIKYRKNVWMDDTALGQILPWPGGEDYIIRYCRAFAGYGEHIVTECFLQPMTFLP
jgi:hypothetical protein